MGYFGAMFTWVFGSLNSEQEEVVSTAKAESRCLPKDIYNSHLVYEGMLPDT